LYATAASGIKRILSREELRRRLTDAFDSSKLQRLERSKQQRMLRRMENLVLGPWAGVITTNFDTLIELGFSRFLQASPFSCDGGKDSLGNVLCLPLGAGPYFVKLHGDTWADSQILSTSDYVQSWMSSPRIRHFVTAVMMRYRLVFIGCSLEDVILQLRLRLWADFGKALPKAFALLPDVAANRLRRQELKEEAGLESLLYPVKKNGTGDGHEAVDTFLQEARLCADLSKSDPNVGTLSAISKGSLVERLEAVGAINRHLLAVLSRQPQCRLKYVHILDPYFDQVPQEKSRFVLSALSEGERLYRIFFLVSLHLIEEQTEGQTVFFRLSLDLLAHVAKSPLAEGAQ
jgi:hypothetical protein